MSVQTLPVDEIEEWALTITQFSEARREAIDWAYSRISDPSDREAIQRLAQRAAKRVPAALMRAYVLREIEHGILSRVRDDAKAAERNAREAWAASDEGQAEQRRLQAEKQAQEVEFQARIAEADKRIWAEHVRRMVEITERYKQEVITEARIEWTRELLDTAFALGDGTSVKWGSATREQHAARERMFDANVQGNLMGAAMHRAAIELLESTGAECLNEVVE